MLRIYNKNITTELSQAINENMPVCVFMYISIMEKRAENILFKIQSLKYYFFIPLSISLYFSIICGLFGTHGIDSPEINTSTSCVQCVQVYVPYDCYGRLC